MLDFLFIFPTMLSCLLLGALFVTWREIRGARKEAPALTQQYKAYLQQASDANNTIATHITTLEARIESLEFLVKNSGGTNNKSAWGK